MISKYFKIPIFLILWIYLGQSTSLSKEVYINYAVNQLTNIDYVNQTFEIDFYFQQYWKIDSIDLIDSTAKDSSIPNGTEIDLTRLTWYPKNDFTNAISIEPIGDISYSCIDGYILMDARYKGTFYKQMDLKDFPFDNQDLTIHLEDFIKTIDELVYQYGSPFDPNVVAVDTCLISSTSAFETDTDFSEFHLNDVVKAISTEHEYEFTANPQTYSELQFVLNVSRKKGFYFSKVISISLLIVLMSWIVFYMNVSDLQSRVGFSITAFLALTAHNFVVNDLLPMISYLTTMDHIVLGTNILVFFTVIENIVVARIASKVSIEKAKEIDLYCFFGSLTFFITLCVFIFIKSVTNVGI